MSYIFLDNGESFNARAAISAGHIRATLSTRGAIQTTCSNCLKGNEDEPEVTIFVLFFARYLRERASGSARSPDVEIAEPRKVWQEIIVFSFKPLAEFHRAVSEKHDVPGGPQPPNPIHRRRYASKQLVHLRITDNGRVGSFRLTHVIVLELRQQFHVLEICDLALALAQNPWIGVPIVLPCLHYFRLRARTLPFSALVPTLERLTLDITYIESTVLLDNLRPAQRLANLQLIVNPNPSDDLWNFRSAPQLDITSFTQFLPHSEQPVCPSLHRLKLHNMSAVSDDELLAIIQARSGPEGGSVARLMQLSANMEREMQRDIMPQLQTLIDEGLDVSLVYHPPRPPTPDAPWEGVVEATSN
ncbi:hypothetical protein C8R44DRAFT_726409 [Mycena epipterygia]|nr:hypothetical protein C8R44DRAFT_726409 [Mycena epipterygia]